MKNGRARRNRGKLNAEVAVQCAKRRVNRTATTTTANRTTLGDRASRGFITISRAARINYSEVERRQPEQRRPTLAVRLPTAPLQAGLHRLLSESQLRPT